jgi:hypothetical protein
VAGGLAFTGHRNLGFADRLGLTGRHCLGSSGLELTNYGCFVAGGLGFIGGCCFGFGGVTFSGRCGFWVGGLDLADLWCFGVGVFGFGFGGFVEEGELFAHQLRDAVDQLTGYPELLGHERRHPVPREFCRTRRSRSLVHLRRQLGKPGPQHRQRSPRIPRPRRPARDGTHPGNLVAHAARSGLHAATDAIHTIKRVAPGISLVAHAA